MVSAGLSSLPEALAVRVRSCVDAVVRGAGEELASVALVARRHGRAAELVIILRRAHAATLANIGHQVAQVVGSDLRLLILTEHELLRSADVFALELADLRARAVVLHGDAPFAEIHSTPADLRLALERALRLLGRSLRDALAMSESRDAALDLDRLATIAHHWIAMEHEPPRDEDEALARALRGAGGDASALLAHRAAFRESEKVDHSIVVADLLEAVDALTRQVDAHGSRD
jgi:hypothetical protein